LSLQNPLFIQETRRTRSSLYTRSADGTRTWTCTGRAHITYISEHLNSFTKNVPPADTFTFTHTPIHSWTASATLLLRCAAKKSKKLNIGNARRGFDGATCVTVRDCVSVRHTLSLYDARQHVCSQIWGRRPPASPSPARPAPRTRQVRRALIGRTLKPVW
jgi:hypothetical protein